MSRLRVYLTIHDQQAFLPAGISFANVMYFYFGIVQAFSTLYACGGRGSLGVPRRVRGDIPRYAAACVTRPVKPTNSSLHSSFTS
jgi:hypothetical protein